MTAQFSIELLPPLADERPPLQAWEQLSELGPEFVTIAALPGRMPAPAAAGLVQSHVQAPCAPTLTSRDIARVALPSVLDRMRHAGIQRMVIVRGDASSDLPAPFDYPRSLDLIQAVRELWKGKLHIDAGAHPEGHPEGRGPVREVEYLLAKLDAGTDGLITQFCYNPDAVLRLRDRLEAKRPGIPLRAGILLSADLGLISKLSTEAGVSIPPALRKALVADRDDPRSGHARTLEFLAGLFDTLHRAGIAPHLYSMNDVEAARAVTAGSSG